MTNTQRPPLGAFIREAREQAGLSIRQLAAQAEIDHTYLSRIERGHNDRPTAEVLNRLADMLDVDRSELLAYIGVKPVMPEPRVYFRSQFGVSAEEADEMLSLLQEYQSKREQHKDSGGSAADSDRND